MSGYEEQRRVLLCVEAKASGRLWNCYHHVSVAEADKHKCTEFMRRKSTLLFPPFWVSWSDALTRWYCARQLTPRVTLQ